ncbi:amidohydrolase family protein, partial [Flavihumibacter sp. CACIAM 22H1]|uniref:amidohydrolase family protein n=1 Tax=Flavihumibacter sp. CACIAM 22H1 TaxID=1812911 RepID=UPI0007A7C553
DGTVLVQVNQDREENYRFTEAARHDPFIKGVVGWVDLVAEDLAEQLQELKNLPQLKGFRHIAQAEPPDYLARKEIIKGIKELGKQGFTYDILVKPDQLEAAIELVKACPDQPFVLDHIAKPYIKAGKIEGWQKHMQEMGKLHNLSCKVSGIITEADWKHWTAEQIAPYLEITWEAFGAKRLLFGSDWPVCLVAGSYKQVVELAGGFVQALSSDEQADFWGGNAVRFYRL